MRRTSVIEVAGTFLQELQSIPRLVHRVACPAAGEGRAARAGTAQRGRVGAIGPGTAPCSCEQVGKREIRESKGKIRKNEIEAAFTFSKIHNRIWFPSRRGSAPLEV